MVLEYHEEDVLPPYHRSSSMRVQRVRVIDEVSYDEALSVLATRNQAWATWCKAMLARRETEA